MRFLSFLLVLTTTTGCNFNMFSAGPSDGSGALEKNAVVETRIPSSLALSTTPSNTPSAGVCTPLALTIEDQHQKEINLAQDTSVSFSVTMGKLYLDDKCSMPLLSPVIFPKGQSTGTLYFAADQDGLVTFAASANNLKTGVFQTTVVRDAQAINFSGVTSARLGICEAYRVTVLDGTGTAFNLKMALPVTLSGGSFYSDLNCTNPTSLLTVNAGTSSAPIYRKALAQGEISLIANSTGFAAASLPISVSASFESLTLTIVPATSSLEISTCTRFRVQAFDALGGAFPAGNAGIPFTLQVSGNAFANETCTGTSITSRTIAPGSSSEDFYLKVNSSSPATLKATATNTLVAETTIPVIRIPRSLNFVQSDPLVITADQCSPEIAVRFLDAGLGEVGVAAATSLTFSGVGSGLLYADGNCTKPINGSLLIPQGSSRASVYYRNSAAQSLTSLLATANGLTANRMYSVANAVNITQPPQPNSVAVALPQTYVDTTYSEPANANVIRVAANANLQSAINAANPGDVLELEAGATFTGNFVLPKKSTIGWITIRSSKMAALPPPGTRVSPADAVNMPRIVSPNSSPALWALFGASYYRFIGVEVTTTLADVNTLMYSLIMLGAEGASDPSVKSELADHIHFYRCYIHALPTTNMVNLINLRGAEFALVDSYASEAHSINGPESQVIQSVLGTGPYKIVNNFISSAGIGIIIGGGGKLQPESMIPSDLEVSRNHFFKSLKWKKTDPQFGGIAWYVKNQFELKHGRRVLFEGNLLENNWQFSQSGYSILLTPRDQVIEDVTIRNNVIKNSDQGFQMGSTETYLRRVLVENNIYFNTTSVGITAFDLGGANGRAIENLYIHKNTFCAPRTSLIFLEGTAPAVRGLSIRDNIFRFGNYGIIGSGTAPGVSTLQAWVADYLVTKNLFIGADPAYQTSGPNFSVSFYASNESGVGFSDLKMDDWTDFRLLPTSPYQSLASDGGPLGANIDRILQSFASP